VLLHPGCHGPLCRHSSSARRAVAPWLLWPLCRSARRHAAAPWLAWRRARRLAKAVFLIHRKGGGWRRLGCARGGLGAS
jgi:hypothetical protein